MRYGMILDLKRCIGCNACTIACKQKNGTPPGVYWARVIIDEIGTYPNVRMTSLPLLCMHCKDAACLKACPTGATQKLENGIVHVDKEKCIGCRACMVACPYNARSLTYNGGSYYPERDATAYEKTLSNRHIKGSVGKCDFCTDRLDLGLEPACVKACPAKARIFGDLDDPESEVSKLLVKREHKQLHTEYGTEPSNYYLS